MSFGFKFKNNNNETIIDDTGVKPWFYGQAPFTGSPLQNYLNAPNPEYNVLNTIYTDPDTGYYTGTSTSFIPYDSPTVTYWYVYRIDYSVPNYNCFIVWNLPDQSAPIYYNCPKPFHLVGEGGTISIYAYVANTTTAGIVNIPNAYIFVADPVPNGALSTGFGMQIFDQSQQCTFDALKKHFQPLGFFPFYAANPNSYVYNSGDFYVAPEQSVSLVDDRTLDPIILPSTPAFNLPSIEIIKATYDDNTGTTTAIYANTLYRREGNTLRIATPKIKAAIVSNTASAYYNVSDQMSYGLGMIVDAGPLNQGYTPTEFPTTYQLSVNKPGIVEDQNPSYNNRNDITITLDTTGLATGTYVPYTITGTNITSGDLSASGSYGLTGNFIIINNQAKLGFQALPDGMTEGTETATLSLNNGKASINFTISDAQSYSLTSSLGNPQEGQSIYVYLTTTGVANNTQVNYTITGIQQADLTTGSLTGYFTVNNNAAQLQFSFAKDAVNDYESMVLSLTGVFPAASITIPIVNVPYANETLIITPSTFTTAETCVIQIYGGFAYDQFEFNIAPQGTNVIDTWNNTWVSGVPIGTLYLDENGGFYNNTSLGSDFGGVGNWKLTVRFLTSKNFRSANVTVTGAPTFSITGSDGTKGPWSVNEGGTGYFKVTTTYIPNGTVVYPKFVNTSLDSSDYTNSAASGLTIQNGVGNFTISFAADLKTEGNETGTLVVDYPNGTRKDTYGVITVNDTSLTPATYSLLINNTNTPSEGGYIDFTFNTNQPAGSLFYWTITGISSVTQDIDYVLMYIDYGDGNGITTYSLGQVNSGSFYYNQYGLGYEFFRVYLRADVTTEGAESAVFSIRSGSITGTQLATANFTIQDTSTYPANGTPNGNPYCVGYDKYQRYNNGSGGTYSTLIEANSSFCGYVSYNQTISIYSQNDYTNNLYQTEPGVINISGGAPNTAFVYSILNTADAQPTYWPGTGVSLDENGNFYNYSVTGSSFDTAQRAKRLWVKFADNHIRYADVNIYYNPGTLSGGQYCSGYTLTQNYWNGRGGTYSQNVQSNSPTCGYVTQYYPYTAQTYFFYYNQDYVHDLWTVYGAKPYSGVKLQIISGPAGVGNSVTVNSDGDGTAQWDPGNAPYPAGLYTINITFPGLDAYYPSSYRTLVAYWYVMNASGGGGGY